MSRVGSYVANFIFAFNFIVPSVRNLKGELSGELPYLTLLISCPNDAEIVPSQRFPFVVYNDHLECENTASDIFRALPAISDIGITGIQQSNGTLTIKAILMSTFQHRIPTYRFKRPNYSWDGCFECSKRLAELTSGLFIREPADNCLKLKPQLKTKFNSQMQYKFKYTWAKLTHLT